MLLGHKGVIPSIAVAKFLAVVVMITSTVVVSVLTGVIASAITVAHIGLTVRHPDDLRHFRIATVASTTSVDYLRERHLNFQEAATVELAIESLVAEVAKTFGRSALLGKPKLLASSATKNPLSPPIRDKSTTGSRLRLTQTWAFQMCQQ